MPSPRRLKRPTGRHRTQPDPEARLVGERIRRLRLERDFSFDAFVEETGLGRGYVSELERGLVVPSLTSLSRVASALEVTVADLVLGSSLREQLFALSRQLDPGELRRLFAHAETAAAGTTPFHRVEGTRAQRYRTALPLEHVRPAAGRWSGWQEPGTDAWVEPPPEVRVAPGRFVAQVLGASMQPQVPHGAYAVFERPWPVPEPHQVGIFMRHEAGDPDGGARFTLKEYVPTRRRLREGEAITGSLRPRNRAFSPLEPVPGEEARERPWARLVRVL